MRTIRRFAAAAMLSLASAAAAQSTGNGAPPGEAPAPLGIPADGPLAGAESMDPMVRAVLFALVARALRDAAKSPDPLGALAETLERSITSAATSPQALKTIEALTAHALKDAPPELRQALGEFILSALRNAGGARAGAR